MYVSKIGEDKFISFEIRDQLEATLLQFRVNVMLFGHTVRRITQLVAPHLSLVAKHDAFTYVSRTTLKPNSTTTSVRASSSRTSV